MYRQAGTGPDPGALAGAAPLTGDTAAGSPAVTSAERGRSGPARGVQCGVPARADSMPARLHHIVAGAHDLPGLARFWTQAPGWMILREREIVIGTEEDAQAGKQAAEDRRGREGGRLRFLTRSVLLPG